MKPTKIKVEYNVINLSQLVKSKIIPKAYIAEIHDARRNLNPDSLNSEICYVSASRLGSFICDDKVLNKLEALDESFGDEIVYIDLNN